MTCPDCASVVLFGEHYHRPGCDFGRELRATEFEAQDEEADCDHCDCWTDHRATCCDCGVSE